jgi:ectoine hydroxylase-related dioxygenase (phytanoyl-CoA dioxygenase family)
MTTLCEVAPDEAALARYFSEGEARALALGNRGPVRIGADGKLAPDIVDAFREFGFYVFENVIDPAELADLRAEFHGIVDRLPTNPIARTDHQGRPALGLDLTPSPFHWSKPLGDPMGGVGGIARSPVRMIEGKPTAAQPEEVVFIIRAPLQFSDAALRTYAHPSLLTISATINGDDFVPFSEGFIVKQPGAGAAFAWHQDGMTHWDSPHWDPLIHGFNFMLQLYRSTAANGVWFVPGSHLRGKVDIAARIADVGSNLLPDAVPLICNPGDVTISNRHVMHASFSNGSDDLRVTLNMGFHRRSAVLDVRSRGDHGAEPYNAEHIRKRSEMIGYAIDARRQYYPLETPFTYEPHWRNGEVYRWNDAARPQINGYYVRDLNI